MRRSFGSSGFYSVGDFVAGRGAGIEARADQRRSEKGRSRGILLCRTKGAGATAQRCGISDSEWKTVLAALVDASGYSTAIQQKYQGLLITETKLNIGGAELAPGQYGFGFTADGKFVVMDVANNDVLSVAFAAYPEMQHAVPLKLEPDGSGYKLYAGKKWVGIKAE